MTQDVTTSNLKINVLTQNQYESTTQENDQLYFVEETDTNTWLVALSDTAPSTAYIDARYYNTTEKLIYSFNGTTWVNGVTPNGDDLYIDENEHTTYAWDGTDLVQVGGGQGGITTDDIDGETITLNEEEKIQANGLVNKNGGYVHTWSGSKAQYEALEEIHDNWMYYITDDNVSTGNISMTNVFNRLNRAYAWTSHNITGNGSAYIVGYNGSSYFYSDAISAKNVIGNSSSNFNHNDYIILDGKLYYKTTTSSTITLQQVGSDNTWTVISGNCLAINNGNLYNVSNITPTLRDSGGWQKVSFTYSTYYCLGIKNDCLYTLYNYGQTRTLRDSSGVWTQVEGYTTGTTSYGFGIKDGKLYSVNTSSVTQISSDNTWTMISGTDDNVTSYNNFGLGINDGNLYVIKGNNVYLVNNTETWVKVCGYNNNASFAITESGKLYKIGGNSSYVYTATQIGTDTTWIDISGYNTTSLGINNGNVYINLSTPTQLTTVGGFTKVYGSHDGAFWTGSTTDDLHTVYTVPAPEVGFTEYSDMDMTQVETITSVDKSNNTITDTQRTYTRDSVNDKVFNGVSVDSKNQLISMADLLNAIKG